MRDDEKVRHVMIEEDIVSELAHPKLVRYFREIMCWAEPYNLKKMKVLKIDTP